MKNSVISPKMSLLLVLFAFIFATGFTSQKVKISLGTQQSLIRQELLRVDQALQSCIDKTISNEPTSLEAARAVGLREKIFFAMDTINQRPESTKATRISDDEALFRMRSTLKEVRSAKDLGLICSASIAKINSKKRIRQSGLPF